MSNWTRVPKDKKEKEWLVLWIRTTKINQRRKTRIWGEDSCFEEKNGLDSKAKINWWKRKDFCDILCYWNRVNSKGNDWNFAYQTKSTGLHLTKLFQKEKEPIKMKAPRLKRQRIVTVTEVIEATQPRVSAPKVPAIESTTATEAVPSEAAAEEARAEDAKSEDINVKSIAANIDTMLLNMAAEEPAAATEETTATKPEKEEMTEDTSEDETFDFQNLVGQELTKVEKEELKEYAISCGYRPGALLFGGVDDEGLGCIRDQTGTKVIGTLSKSIGFSKLEADISRYRRQHIVGSLFYSNFKVNILCLTLTICNNTNIF
jgi:hypothetical protein